MALTRVKGSVKTDKIFNTIADAKAVRNAAVGDVIQTIGYTSANDGGGALYRVVAAATGTDDGGSYHDMTNVSGQLEQIFDGEIKASTFGVTFDGVDTTTRFQALLNYAESVDLPILLDKNGDIKITSTCTYSESNTDTNTSSGLVLRGMGMGKTRFINSVSNGPMLSVESTSPYFAKGGVYEDFTITGDGSATDSSGIKTKGAWRTSFKRVRIRLLKGNAVVAGDDSTVINPDTTANASITFENCELDENYGGFYNPVNNNAPTIVFIGTGINNNHRFGVKANSSYINFKNSSVSFNGIRDQANAEGGIVIREETGTTFSSGYRAKGASIVETEIDTNYPVNVDFRQCVNPIIESCSTQFSDAYFTAAEWTAFGITTFPTEQFRLGGNTTTEKCYLATFRNNRCSINHTGNLTLSGHTIFHDYEYAQGTKIERVFYNLVTTGATIGTDYFIFKEKDKTPSYGNNRRYYADFDYPTTNVTTPNIYPAGFDFQLPRVLPAWGAREAENIHFAFTIADDSFKQIRVPQTLSQVTTAGTNYNFLAITKQGQSAQSGLVLVRATGGPVCSIITNGTTTLTATTGPLTGTTGTPGDVTVSADTDGTVYIENRTGGNALIHCSWLLAPSFDNQV